MLRSPWRAATEVFLRVTRDENKNLLHFACQSSHPELVTLLIECGVDVNTEDFYQKTPYDYAKTNLFFANEANLLSKLIPMEKKTGYYPLDRFLPFKQKQYHYEKDKFSCPPKQGSPYKILDKTTALFSNEKNTSNENQEEIMNVNTINNNNSDNPEETKQNTSNLLNVFGIYKSNEKITDDLQTQKVQKNVGIELLFKYARDTEIHEILMPAIEEASKKDNLFSLKIQGQNLKNASLVEAYLGHINETNEEPHQSFYDALEYARNLERSLVIN